MALKLGVFMSTVVLPPSSHASTFEPIDISSPSNQLPADLYELSEKHYGECNVRPYFVKLGMAQEAIRDQKLTASNIELKRMRGQLDTITTFLGEVQDQLKKGNHVDLTGKNELTDKLHEILPDKRLKETKLSRSDAELLCHALTRKSENHITPDIEDLTNDMTHIIEDLDKILPILKDLMKAYDDLINRINNKQK
jgi:hypothetical protein